MTNFKEAEHNHYMMKMVNYSGNKCKSYITPRANTFFFGRGRGDMWSSRWSVAIEFSPSLPCRCVPHSMFHMLAAAVLLHPMRVESTRLDEHRTCWCLWFGALLWSLFFFLPLLWNAWLHNFLHLSSVCHRAVCQGKHCWNSSVRHKVQMIQVGWLKAWLLYPHFFF